MKKDCLIYFESPESFSDFVEKYKICEFWRIEEGKMNDRGKVINSLEITQFLRNLFAKKEFFRRQVSIAEIVSWMDNLSMLVRLLRKLKNEISSKEYNDLQIFFEYRISLSKNMRIDLLFKYNNRILLLEQRTVNNFEKLRPTWQKKITECLVYKELISYYMPDDKLILYAMIMMFEFRNNYPISKNICYNNNQINYLIRYMKAYIFID